MNKINVVNIGINTTSYKDVVDAVNLWLDQPPALPSPARYICVTSVHGIITARTDAELQSVLNQADIATPDGMPVVWALRSLGARSQARVYGPNLMLHLCEAMAQRGSGVFLYGGRPEVLPELRKRLGERIPHLKVTGSYSPPFRPLSLDEDEAIISMIRESRADLILVGISTPKQEKWMAAHLECFPGKVLVGVGAAFDFHAGRVRQAPQWIQGAGLEWLFRLTMEPARLWKRYLLVTPQFLPLWGLQKVRLVFKGK